MSRPRKDRAGAYAKQRERQRRRQDLRNRGIDPRKHKTGQCTAKVRTGKNFGKRCPMARAVVELNGKRYAAKWCFAHIPSEYREKWGLPTFGGPQPNAGRPRVPKLTEMMREIVEQEAMEHLLPLFNALQAQKPVVVGNGRFARVEMFSDHRTQLAAFAELMDRIYGKSKQVTELTGADGGPVSIEVPTDQERESEVARILAESGALRNVDPKAVAAEMISASQNPVNQN